MINPLTGLPSVSLPNSKKIAQQINNSQLLQAGVLVLGLVVTISLAMNNYYSMKLNKLKIKESQKALGEKVN